MRAAIPLAALVVLVAGLAWHGVPAADLEGPPLRASATPALAIAADTGVAARGDRIGYVAWLNVTGGGSIQITWLNLSFDPGLSPDAGNATTPSGCTRVTPFGWQCNGLRAGSYAWSVSADVMASAATGRFANGTAEATTFQGGAYRALPRAVASTWIAGADIEMSIRNPPPPGVRPQERVAFTVDAVNRDVDGTGQSAYNVSLTFLADPSFILDPNTDLTISTAQLTPGSILSLSFQALVAGNATVGGLLGIRIELRYEDPTYRPITPAPFILSLAVLAPDVVSPSAVAGGVAAFALALGSVISFAYLAGQRRLQIDEVFLMHRSGILIRHFTRGPALKKDDDLVASMLVAVQDFVRDSFRAQATLDAFSFGGRHAAIVRGEHVVLAAILSRGDVRFLMPQLQGAVRDLEKAHGADLANWDGRIARLDRAPPIIEGLLQGAYRATRTWTEWARGARMRFSRMR